MVFKNLCAAAVLCATSSCASASLSKAPQACDNESSVKISAASNNGVDIAARSCGNDEGAGLIEIEISADGQLRQAFQVPYDSIAFALNVDSNIDLNNDGVEDLSVGTGSGKGGEGTYYWIRDPKHPRYHRVGEFPLLSFCPSNDGTFYSVVPGSGETISTWFYYQLFENTLEPVLSISVAADDSEDLLSLTPLEMSAAWATTGSNVMKTISEIDADTYLKNICAELPQIDKPQEKR